ncbi:MAG: hypothetical protein IK130_03755 [Oscillospiraceae bacterium]|nr:hypothetical protein [Oscillospiraceae bacterium]
MSNEITALKQQLNDAIQAKGEWQPVYTRLMQAVYDLPVLFVALSKSEFQPDTHMSKPLISKKDFDGMPTVYLFSDVEIASAWMRHYRHVTDDMKYGLIGALHKEENEFLNLFQIAAKLGIQNLLLDEGGAMVGLRTDPFIEANNIDPNDIKLRISVQELEQLQKSGTTPALHFAEVEAIPLAMD